MESSLNESEKICIWSALMIPKKQQRKVSEKGRLQQAIVEAGISKHGEAEQLNEKIKNSQNIST